MAANNQAAPDWETQPCPQCGRRRCEAPGLAECGVFHTTTTPLTDYARGYRDGVTAASLQIADHYRAMQQKHRQTAADIVMANGLLDSLVLAELAPLQDRVNRLRTPEAESNGG